VGVHELGYATQKTLTNTKSKKMSYPYATLELINQLGEKMFNIEEEYAEFMTKDKCVECDDKLTVWEETYCIICDMRG
jgi:hypothetical protein